MAFHSKHCRWKCIRECHFAVITTFPCGFTFAFCKLNFWCCQHQSIMEAHTRTSFAALVFNKTKAWTKRQNDNDNDNIDDGCGRFSLSFFPMIFFSSIWLLLSVHHWVVRWYGQILNFRTLPFILTNDSNSIYLRKCFVLLLFLRHASATAATFLQSFVKSFNGKDGQWLLLCFSLWWNYVRTQMIAPVWASHFIFMDVDMARVINKTYA